MRTARAFLALLGGSRPDRNVAAVTRLGELTGRPARWWSSLGIARRIRLAVLGMALSCTSLAAAFSFTAIWTLVRRDLDERLTTGAERTARDVTRAVDDLARDLARLAQNSLIVNALADSRGRDAYVVPFLKDHRLAGSAHVRIYLCDSTGRVVVGNGPADEDFHAERWVREVLDGSPHAALRLGAGVDLVLAYPVVHSGTELPEGILVAQVPLATALAPAPLPGLEWRLVSADGLVLAASPPDAGRAWLRAVSLPVARMAPVDVLRLRAEVGVTRWTVVRPFALLVAASTAIGLAIVLVAVRVASAIARRLTQPVRALGDAAHEIARTGTFDLSLPSDGGEEIATLAGAFNEMLRRLREATEARYALEVAQKREAMSALHAAHQAMEQASEAIAILGRDGVFTYANRAARALSGRGGDLVGTRVWEFDRARSQGWWHGLWQELSARGPVAVSGPLSRGGRTLQLETTFSLFHLDARDLCVATFRDVTDRTHAEMMRRMASLGTLAAGVAREVNNPLAWVLSNLEYVAGAYDRAAAEPGQPLPVVELRRAVGESLAGVQHVRDIVRSLKRFSGPDDTHRRPVDVRAELETSLALAGNEIRHRARLARRLADVAPVVAAEHELGQVFVNLLVNAAQAIPEGSPDRHRIEVACAMDGDAVVVEVRDTGSGIAPEVRNRIFEPFFTTKPVGVGTGLGLSICHAIVAQLGGRMEVDSELGRGSTFRVVLPAAKALAPEARPRQAAVAPARRRRVLVIDDEALVGRALGRMLGQDVEVACVSSAREALEAISAGDVFDAILCDLMMPEMSGMQFHDELATSGRAAAAARIAFMTGGAFTVGAREFLERVPNPVLEKPFTREGVRAVLARLADGTTRAA